MIIYENIRMFCMTTSGCRLLKHGDVVYKNMGMFLAYLLNIKMRKDYR